MAARELKHGDTVRTPAGQMGRILRQSNTISTWLTYMRYDLDGQADVVVYAVLLEDGEVRMYSYAALAAANNPPA